MFQNNKTNIYISIILVIEFGSCLLGTEAWDEGNTENGDGWKQIISGLSSESPSSFSISFSSISQWFKELVLFLLELGSPRSGSEWSWSGSTVWGDGLRAGTEERDGSSHVA